MGSIIEKTRGHNSRASVALSDETSEFVHEIWLQCVPMRLGWSMRTPVMLLPAVMFILKIFNPSMLAVFIAHFVFYSASKTLPQQHSVLKRL